MPSPSSAPSSVPSDGLRSYAAALAGTLRQLAPRRDDWDAAYLRRDLTAGLMVALVALPLALGFGVSSGLGAAAGLTTAIVAGALAAVFGGSRVQVSGPTGAMTVVLVPVVAAYGPGSVLVVGLLAGVVLVGLALAGAGKAIHYVPTPVIEGFTVGIAAIIALQQVPAGLGVSVPSGKVLAQAFDALTAWVRHPNLVTAGLTLAVVVAVLAFGRFRPGWPGPLVVVLVATVANAQLNLGAATIGAIPAGLPTPRFPTIGWTELSTLVLPALAVAALAALESLLSASVADALTVGDRHEPDRELFGQGVANLVVPLFGGIPATAAIARTAVNVRSGAVTRLAALSHALILLVVALVAARWVATIPVAALAGVLIATAARMVQVSSLAPLVRATRGDAAVLVTTAAATILTDLVTAVVVGLALAGFVALRQTARTARLDRSTPEQEAAGLVAQERSQEAAVLDEHIVVFRMEGPLFFAAAHDFLLELASVGDVRVVVLRMSHVTTLDATGAHVLADTVRRLEGRGVTVMLSGVRPGHARILEGLGVFGSLAHAKHVFESTPLAIEHARVHVARMPHTPAHG